jgi:hypothetical protein
MKVPSKLVFLGYTYEVNIEKADGQIVLMTYQLVTKLGQRTSRTPHCLCCDPAGKTLIIAPMRNFKIKKARGGQSAGHRLFGRWADYDADLSVSFTIPDSSTTLHKAGKLYRMEYTSDKIDRDRDQKGRFNVYVHRFKKPLDFYADSATSPRVWAAKSNRKIVTARGLIG